MQIVRKLFLSSSFVVMNVVNDLQEIVSMELKRHVFVKEVNVYHQVQVSRFRQRCIQSR